ncbi:MAG: AgmX/PglI C-terminal domain-containing protein [Polyangiaceae bacterium]
MLGRAWLLVAVSVVGCTATRRPPEPAPAPVIEVDAEAPSGEALSAPTGGASIGDAPPAMAAASGAPPEAETTDGEPVDADTVTLAAPRPQAIPKIRIASPTVGPRYGKELIQRVIRREHAAMRRCYETARQTAPSLEGKLTIRFVIGPDGRVTDAVTAESLEPGMDACVETVIRGLTFPAPDHVINVRYPFVFRAA